MMRFVFCLYFSQAIKDTLAYSEKNMWDVADTEGTMTCFFPINPEVPVGRLAGFKDLPTGFSWVFDVTNSIITALTCVISATDESRQAFRLSAVELKVDLELHHS